MNLHNFYHIFHFDYAYNVRQNQNTSGYMRTAMTAWPGVYTEARRFSGTAFVTYLLEKSTREGSCITLNYPSP
jgi:hypothetical protein